MSAGNTATGAVKLAQRWPTTSAEAEKKGMGWGKCSTEGCPKEGAYTLLDQAHKKRHRHRSPCNGRFMAFPVSGPPSTSG